MGDECETVALQVKGTMGPITRDTCACSSLGGGRQPTQSIVFSSGTSKDSSRQLSNSAVAGEGTEGHRKEAEGAG